MIFFILFIFIYKNWKNIEYAMWNNLGPIVKFSNFIIFQSFNSVAKFSMGVIISILIMTAFQIKYMTLFDNNDQKSIEEMKQRMQWTSEIFKNILYNYINNKHLELNRESYWWNNIIKEYEQTKFLYDGLLIGILKNLFYLFILIFTIFLSPLYLFNSIAFWMMYLFYPIISSIIGIIAWFWVSNPLSLSNFYKNVIF